MKMNNKTYDILKYIALIFLPCLETFILGLTKVWGIPYGVEVGATVALIAVFLGGCLKVSTDKYNKGDE